MRILQVLFMLSLIQSTIAYSISDYDVVRNNLKSDLYSCQQGLMGYKEYSAFIEPYLQEAEETLLVCRYVMKNPRLRYSALAGEFLACFLNYNVRCFRDYTISQSLVLRVFRRQVRTNSKNDLQQAYDNLLRSVKNINDAIGSEEFNSNEEMGKIVQLIQKANSDYYKKLGISFRLNVPLYFLFC